MDVQNIIRNRIVEFKKMRLGDIAHCPFQWKIHTEKGKSALAALVEKVGFAGVPLVYKSEITGTWTFADGHRRKETMPDHVAYVAITDLTDEDVEWLIVSYDPIAEEADTNLEILGSLLQKLNTDKPALQSFLANLAEKKGLDFLSEKGNRDDPDFSSLNPDDDRYKEQYGVIVICEDEGHQEQVYNDLSEQGYHCRVVVT